MNSQAIPINIAQSQTTHKRSRPFFIYRRQVRFALNTASFTALFPLFFLGLLSILTRLQILLTGVIPEKAELYQSLPRQAVLFASDHAWLLLGTLVYIGVVTFAFSLRFFGQEPPKSQSD
jgi:hypothetical protein